MNYLHLQRFAVLAGRQTSIVSNAPSKSFRRSLTKTFKSLSNRRLLHTVAVEKLRLWPPLPRFIIAITISKSRLRTSICHAERSMLSISLAPYSARGSDIRTCISCSRGSRKRCAFLRRSHRVYRTPPTEYPCAIHHQLNKCVSHTARVPGTVTSA